MRRLAAAAIAVAGLWPAVDPRGDAPRRFPQAPLQGEASRVDPGAGVTVSFDGVALTQRGPRGTFVVREPKRVEEFLLVRPGDPRDLEWLFSLPPGRHSFRERGTLEVVDPTGLARLRMEPVRFWRAGGPAESADARLTVVSPREARLSVRLPASDVDILLDPGWIPLGIMNVARSSFTATLLTDGRVLLCGGWTGAAATPTCDILNLATGVWTAAAPMSTGRTEHTATLLANGKVVVVGGNDGVSPLNSSELYDPVLDTWTPTLPANVARQEHTATLLNDGRVLIAGGSNGGAGFTSSELFDPLTNTWSFSAGFMTFGRRWASAVLLPSGQVLVAAGNSGGSVINTAELFLPGPDTWSVTGPLVTARDNFSLTVIPGGDVIAAGGAGAGAVSLSSTERYNPGSGTWVVTGGLSTPRREHGSILLPSGKILATGGFDSGGGGVLNSCELFDPGPGTWSVDFNLGSARMQHCAVLLASGKVLVAGGNNGGSLLSTELHEPGGQNYTVGPSVTTARYAHTTTVLDDGRILAAGGDNGGPLSSAEIFDTVAGTWIATPAMGTGRYGHTATLLANGTVLVAGGNNGATLASCEIYNPVSDSWGPATAMTVARESHTATLLADGRVLVVGGQNPAATASCEIYNPFANTWTVVSPIPGARYGHSATLLQNGDVLVAGGANPAVLATSARYAVATDSWSATGSLPTVRAGHSATLLRDGRVFSAGGTTGGGVAIAACALFDPAGNTWSGTISLNNAQYNHQAVLLPGGKVYLAGGVAANGAVAFNTGELYDPVDSSCFIIAGLSATRYGAGVVLSHRGRAVIVSGSNTSGVRNPAVDLFEDTSANPFWGAQIAQINAIATTPVTVSAGGSITVTGTGFRGISGNGGGESNSTTSDVPIVALSRLGDGYRIVLRATNWSFGSSLDALLPPAAALPAGHYLVNVIVNGIPGPMTLASAHILRVPGNFAPGLPTAMGQFLSDAVTPILPGGTTTDTAPVFIATVTDPESDLVRLEVELQPIASPFTGTPNLGSAFVASGSSIPVMTSPLALGGYHWQARGADNLGNAGPWQMFGAGTNFSVVSGALPAPTPLSPVGTTEAAITPTFTWTAVAGATGYEFDVAADAGFLSIESSQAGISGTSALSGPLPEGPHFWRVRAAGGPFSAIASFNTALTPLADVTNGLAALTVRFSATFPGAVLYEWDFDFNPLLGFQGDFFSSTSGDSIFIYAESGSFTAKLRIHFPGGTYVEKTIVVTVSPPPAAPAVSVGASLPGGPVPLTVTFTATVNTFDGTVSAFLWDFNGDGVTDASSGTSNTVTHTFTEPGAFTVGSTVVDALGNAGSGSIGILATAPVAGTSPAITSVTATPSPALVGQVVTFSATADAGGTGSLVSFLWDFDGNGEPDAITAAGSATHQYDAPGSFTPKLTVLDSENLTATAATAITVDLQPATLKCWLVQPRNGLTIWGNYVSLHANTAPGQLTASVEFKFRPAGGSPFPPPADPSWIPIGSATPPPYSFFGVHWDVTGLVQGASYDLIAVATGTDASVVSSAAMEEITVVVSSISPDEEEFSGSPFTKVRVHGVDPNFTERSEITRDTAVEILQGSTSAYDRMRIERRSENPHPIEGTLQELTFVPGHFRRFGFDGGSTLSKPSKVSLYVRDADRDGVLDGTEFDKSTMRIYRWEDARGRWEPMVDQVVNLDEDLVRAATVSTGDLGVVAETIRPKGRRKKCGLLGLEGALAALVLWRLSKRRV